MNKKIIPLIVAVIIGLIATGYYIFSGRSSLDLTARSLIGENNVKDVNVKNGRDIFVECDNGDKYEFTFQENQGSYEDLIFNACL